MDVFQRDYVAFRHDGVPSPLLCATLPLLMKKKIKKETHILYDRVTLQSYLSIKHTSRDIKCQKKKQNTKLKQ